ncbi:MAG: hypothetical protein AB8B61_02865 [Cyclobacteriaceae bacterium]
MKLISITILTLFLSKFSSCGKMLKSADKVNDAFHAGRKISKIDKAISAKRIPLTARKAVDEFGTPSFENLLTPNKSLNRFRRSARLIRVLLKEQGINESDSTSLNLKEITWVQENSTMTTFLYIRKKNDTWHYTGVFRY